MDNSHDFQSPISIFISMLAVTLSHLSLETWVSIIGLLCAVASTITAVRRNRAQERHFNRLNRQQDDKNKAQQRQ